LLPRLDRGRWAHGDARLVVHSAYYRLDGLPVRDRSRCPEGRRRDRARACVGLGTPPPAARAGGTFDLLECTRIQREETLACPAMRAFDELRANYVRNRERGRLVGEGAADLRRTGAAQYAHGVVAGQFLAFDDGTELGRNRSHVLLFLGRLGPNEMG